MMNSIELMVREHVNIKRMLRVIRSAMSAFMEDDYIDYDDINDMRMFVKDYADYHHHGKEEKLLFGRMMDNIGPAAEKLVKHGMLVEHDLGRLHMMNLVESIGKYKSGDMDAKLDIIANAISYTHLLTRHIDKEDNVVYPLAQRELSSEILEHIDVESDDFEIENKNNSEKYLQILNRLEAKYK